MLTGKFEKGERGPICRRPSDGAAWIVAEREGADPELGVEYALEITGAAKSGRLRFARILGKPEEIFGDVLENFRHALRTPGRVEGDASACYRGVNVEIPTLGRVRLALEGGKLHHKWDGVFGGPLRWLPSFGLTPEVEAAIAVADAAFARTLNEQRAREEERLAALEAERRECIRQEAPLVEAFFKDRPDARRWFSKPYGELSFYEDICLEARKRGLARRRGEPRKAGGLSYRHKFFEQGYVLEVGGKEYAFVVSFDDDECDD